MRRGSLILVLYTLLFWACSEEEVYVLNENGISVQQISGIWEGEFQGRLYEDTGTVTFYTLDNNPWTYDFRENQELHIQSFDSTSTSYWYRGEWFVESYPDTTLHLFNPIFVFRDFPYYEHGRYHIDYLSEDSMSIGRNFREEKYVFDSILQETVFSHYQYTEERIDFTRL